MISDLTEGIQKRFDEIEKTHIEIPIGNLFGTYFLSGMGPNIPIKVLTTGTLDTEVKSEFISKGINQTLHRIYVNFECTVKILTPRANTKQPTMAKPTFFNSFLSKIPSMIQFPFFLCYTK